MSRTQGSKNKPKAVTIDFVSEIAEKQETIARNNSFYGTAAKALRYDSNFIWQTEL